MEGKYTVYKFHFLNGITEIIQLFDDILIYWPAPVLIYTMTFGVIFVSYDSEEEVLNVYLQEYDGPHSYNYEPAGRQREQEQTRNNHQKREREL